MLSPELPLRTGQPFHDLLQNLYGYDGCAVIAFLQGEEVLLCEVGMAKHADPDGGRRKEHRRMAASSRSYRFRIKRTLSGSIYATRHAGLLCMR